MPRIATYQPGQVGPVRVTDARFRAPDNPAGIGAGIAQGLGTLGRSLSDYAEAKDRMDAIADDQESRAGALKLQDVAGESLAQAQTAAGNDARVASDKALKDLTSFQSTLVSQATTSRARKLLQERTDAMMSGYRVQLAEHTAREVRSAAMATATAEADRARDQAVSLSMTHDFQRADVALTLGRDAIRRKADLAGVGEEAANQAVFDYESNVHHATFDSIVASGDWTKAIEYEAAHRDRFNADDATAMAATLRKVVERRQASDDAAAAIGAGAPASSVVAPAGKFSLPVANARVTSGYGAARPGGSRHNGVDLAAPEGSPVTPIAPGKVISVSHDPRSGMFVVVDHGDGLTSSYSHLGRQDVKPGDTVTGSTPLGIVGMTGHTTGPHTHLVVKRDGASVDPMSVIGKTSSAGGKGASWDKRAAYAFIDGQAGWSFERKQAARDEVDSEFARKDAVDAREERDADDAAKKVVLDLGDKFTSITQIPAAVRGRMSIDAVSSFTAMAERNAAPKPVEANGPEFLRLQRLAVENPEAFATMDLTRSASSLTTAEYARLDKDQAEVRTRGPGEVSLRQTIASYINTFATPEMSLTGVGSKARWLSVYKQMEFAIRSLTGGKRTPTDKELGDAFAQSTRSVTVTRPGMLWGTNQEQIPAHDVTVADIPQGARRQIDEALRKRGFPVTDENRVSLYLMGQQ